MVNWVQPKEIKRRIRVERVPLAAARVTVSVEFASASVFAASSSLLLLLSPFDAAGPILSARPSLLVLSFAIGIVLSDCRFVWLLLLLYPLGLLLPSLASIWAFALSGLILMK